MFFCRRLQTLSEVSASFRGPAEEKQRLMLEEVAPSDDGATSSSSVAGEENRKKMLRERNRVHARLSRQRKRQRLDALQEENDNLTRDCKHAREEITRLRGLLEECDYENSRLRAWVDGVMQAQRLPAPSAPPATAAYPQQQAAVYEVANQPVVDEQQRSTMPFQ